MIRWVFPLLLFLGLACVQQAQKVSPDSYAAAVEGIYEGRMSSMNIDSNTYRINIEAVNDSTIRISPAITDGTSAFIARVSGPSATVLRIYYREEQIGTLIGGVVKYKRALGAEYREYFSGKKLAE